LATDAGLSQKTAGWVTVLDDLHCWGRDVTLAAEAVSEMTDRLSEKVGNRFDPEEC